MNYLCKLKFRKGKLSRTIQAGMTDSLYDIAILLYASLVHEDFQDEYLFSFVFGEDSYITRKDEQESLFGYSTEHYHVLEQECLRNVILRNPSSALFRITSLKRPDDLDLEMDIEFDDSERQDKSIRLIDGAGILIKNYGIVDCSFPKIKEMTTKNLPTTKKLRKYKS